MVSVIDMTFLYDTRYSIVLPRPKIDLKLSTQSADEWICMGKWPVRTRAILFLRFQKGQRRSDFSEASFAANVVPEKNEHEGMRGQGQKK